MSIVLEPFTDADIDRLIGWIPSAEFLLQWAGPVFTYPLTRAQLRKHLAKTAGAEPATLMFKAVLPETATPVGHCELVNINRSHGFATVGRVLVGPPNLRGKGLGTQMMRALLSIAFDELALHRVDLVVFDFNTSAIRCYQRLGFQLEGVLREARRCEDAYWNLCVMSLLESEWQREEGEETTPPPAPSLRGKGRRKEPPSTGEGGEKVTPHPVPLPASREGERCRAEDEPQHETRRGMKRCILDRRGTEQVEFSLLLRHCQRQQTGRCKQGEAYRCDRCHFFLLSACEEEPDDPEWRWVYRVFAPPVSRVDLSMMSPALVEQALGAPDAWQSRWIGGREITRWEYREK
ncbi:GNAT family N-acetyltransferase, partial [candidate division KSB3 bacterium]|nr:GNAT family N-acetyltransferase [candidate division KSB3 bacterium]MBD3324654.1 GNAT family N-acetyltransferase [candidate division KSB3 bacterium]